MPIVYTECTFSGWDRVVNIMFCFTMACEPHLVPFTSYSKTEHVCMYVCVLWYLIQEWTQLEKSEGTSWPVERCAHAACCLNYGEEHPQLLVTGGVDNNDNTLQDVWILDVNSGRWRKVTGSDVHMTEYPYKVDP